MILIKWLQINGSKATWGVLELAITNANRTVLGLSKCKQNECNPQIHLLSLLVLFVYNYSVVFDIAGVAVTYRYHMQKYAHTHMHSSRCHIRKIRKVRNFAVICS